MASAGLNAALWYRRDQPLGPPDRAHLAIPLADQHNTTRLSVPSSKRGLWPPTAALTGEGPKPRLPRVPTVDDGSVGDDVVQRATITPSRMAAIIIPGQSGTYRYLQGRVTGLLADSGLRIVKTQLTDGRNASQAESSVHGRLSGSAASPSRMSVPMHQGVQRGPS